MYEFFLYVGTLFNIVYYVTDYYTSYMTYKMLYHKEKLEENINLNAYSLKMRVCILIIDASYLCYYKLSQIEPPVLSYLIFCVCDTNLFMIRIYYMYLLHHMVSKIEKPVIHNPMLLATTTDIQSSSLV